jgi:thiol-disulfide isomerase/thioredoxin
MDFLYRLPTNFTSRVGATRLVMAAAGLIIVAAACGSTATDTSDDGSTDGTSPPAAARSEDALPNFEIEAFGNENFAEGQAISLDTFPDQPVVLNFWYPSCGPCRLEMPHFEAAFQSHQDEVAFIAIQQLGLDTAEDGQEFVNELGLSYAVGADRSGTIIRELNVISFPTTLFLNKDHEIVRKWAGALNEEKLNELIEEISPAS